MSKKNAISMQFKGDDEVLYRWVIAQATKHRRSASAQVRFYLEQIKEGKIKVEGVG